MFPYNQKLWTVSPRVLTTEWLGRFVPRPDLEQVVRGAVSDLPDEAGYNASFHYPIRGGIEALVRALARGVKRIECGVGVKRIDLARRCLGLTTGDEVRFGRLVTCVPLPELIRMIQPVPDRIKKAARKLRWSSVYNLNLGLKRPANDKHWIYVPEDRFAMYRFGYADNFSGNLAPKGMRNVYTEVAYDKRRPPDKKAINNRVVHDLKKMGVIESRKDIVVTHAFDLPHAYAIYDKHRTRSVKTLLNFLESREIFPVGRYGRWEYSAMEDAIAQGLDLADERF